MDKKLLTILCCPVSHQPVSLAKKELLQQVNDAIAGGDLHNSEGTALTEPLREALLTDDGKRLYPIRDGIPVLLEGESIICGDLE